MCRLPRAEVPIAGSRNPSVLLFALVRRVRLTVDRRLWPHFLALGAHFVAQHSVLFLGLIFLTPIFGVMLSWLLLGDPITPALVAGLTLVTAGIALVNRPAPRDGRRIFK